MDPYYTGPYIVHDIKTGELDPEYERRKADYEADPRTMPKPTYWQAITRAAKLNKETGQTWGVGVGPQQEGL
jgi:hypothetical protein